MKKYSLCIFLSILLVCSFPSFAAVRWNPYMGLWEGNICMNNAGWQVVAWQPVGSICTMFWGGMPLRGVIVNL